MEEEGIKSHFRSEVSCIQSVNGRNCLWFKDGTFVASDVVIIAAGITPSVDMFKNSGIELDQGILTDNFCSQMCLAFYAAVDVAEPTDPISGEHRPNPT